MFVDEVIQMQHVTFERQVCGRLKVNLEICERTSTDECLVFGCGWIEELVFMKSRRKYFLGNHIVTKMFVRKPSLIFTSLCVMKVLMPI